MGQTLNPTVTTMYALPGGVTTTSYTTTQSAICPDLLSIDQIGTADGWRGRVVRGFFRVLRLVSRV